MLVFPQLQYLQQSLHQGSQRVINIACVGLPGPRRPLLITTFPYGSCEAGSAVLTATLPVRQSAFARDPKKHLAITPVWTEARAFLPFLPSEEGGSHNVAMEVELLKPYVASGRRNELRGDLAYAASRNLAFNTCCKPSKHLITSHMHSSSRSWHTAI